VLLVVASSSASSSSVASASTVQPTPAVVLLDVLMAGLALGGAALANRTARRGRPATLETR
jgi:hypothetical protein